jgi:hypothetical protein
VPESKRLAPQTNDVINAVCAFYGVAKAQLRAAKRGTVNEERDMAIYLLRYLRGDKLAPIGKAFDIQSYSAVGSVIARFKARMQSEERKKKQPCPKFDLKKQHKLSLKRSQPLSMKCLHISGCATIECILPTVVWPAWSF